MRYEHNCHNFRNTLLKGINVACGINITLLLAASFIIFGCGPNGDKNPSILPPGDVALVGGTLINPSQPPVSDAVVVVRNGRVACAGTRTECPVSGELRRIELNGKYVGPGLIDAHVHYGQNGWIDTQAYSFGLRSQYPLETAVAELQKNARSLDRSFLCSGVTGVFDAGGYAWTLAKARARQQTSETPHTKAAGTILLTRESIFTNWNLPTMPYFVVMKNKSLVRTTIRANAAMGSAAIKIGYLSDTDSSRILPLLKVAKEEADAAGIPLVVHVRNLSDAKRITRVGVHAHMHVISPGKVDSEFIELARQRNVIIVPTITVFEGYIDLISGRSPLERYPGECLDQKRRDRLDTTLPDSIRRPLRDRINIYESIIEVAVQNTQQLHEAGLPIAVGTDAGNPATAHGPAIYREMELLRQAGMSPKEIYASATIVGAKVMRQEDEIGSIEPGKRADIVVYNADPTADISNMRRIHLVLKKGKVYKHSELLPGQ